MKRILTFLAFALLFATTLWAQCTTDTVDVFPWENDFGTNYECWHPLDTQSNISLMFYRTAGYINSTYDTTWYTRLSRSYADSLHACALASQALALPADSTGLQLHWRTRRYYTSGNVQYLILISTTQRGDLSAYDTLVSRTIGTDSWTDVTANLGAYAGQTVYITFCLPDQNREVAIDITHVAVYSPQMPILIMPYVETAMQTGDTSSYSVILDQGSDSALVYSWHSSLSGETRTAPAVAGSITDTFNIVYTTAGIDTITVTATNPWGTCTRSITEMVVSCNAINTFPWSVNFQNPQGPWDPCWQLNDWTIVQTSNANIVDENANQQTLNKCIRSNHNGQRMIITPIAVPTGNAAENLKLWFSFRGFIDILFSTNCSTADSLFTDTVFHWTEDRNTWRMRTIDLQPYAGQTVYAAFVNQATGLAQISSVNYLAVAYDLLPIVTINGQTRTITDSTVVFSTVWQHGASDSLHYLWRSTMADAGLAAWEDTITYPDSLHESTGRITYYAPGTDTITVVAVNSHGSYTVSTTLQVFDCRPVTQLPWTETFATVTPSSPIACWYKPEGSNWVTGINSTTQYEGHRCVFSDAVSDTMDSWLVSRAVVLPLATDFDLRLDWDASISDSTFQHSYSVLITADSNYADLSSYTTLFVDTMPLAQQRTYIWTVYTRRSIDISAWGGQTVRLAFRHQPVHWNSSTKRLFLDNVTVRTTTLPVVELSAPSMVYNDGATYTALLTEGVDSNLIFTWHSTLMDTTWIDSNASGQMSTFNLNYTVGGMDTISVVASNIYGADTLTAEVDVVVRPLPQLTFDAPSNIPAFDSLTYTATLNECSLNGLTVSWHSTLLDTTWAFAGVHGDNHLNVVYPTTGTDTLTIIATNLDGSDTTEAQVLVVDCSNYTIPYVEDFEETTATISTVAGVLPNCWQYTWNGSNEAFAPHVIPANGYQYMSGITSNALFMVAGSAAGYGNRAEAILPPSPNNLRTLLLALSYRQESATLGTLSVGYVDDNGDFTPVDTLPGHSGTYRRDTVSFASATDTHSRIALRWEYSNSWWAVLIDSIKVFVDNAIAAPDTLTVDSIGATYARAQWSAVAGATGYHVEVLGTAIDTTVGGLSLVLQGLVPHTQHTLRVAAIVGSDTGHYASMQFTTGCGRITLPYVNNFASDSASTECWTFSNIDDYYQSGYLLIIRDDNTHPSFLATPVADYPGNRLLVNFRLQKFGYASSNSGTLVAGVMSDPADTSTFTAIDTFTAVNSWTDCQFVTRGVGSNPVAIAFRLGTGEDDYSTVTIDDLSIDTLVTCAELLSVEATSLSATSAELSWQYDTLSNLPPNGVLVTLTDLTSSSVTDTLVPASYTSIQLTGLPLTHSFRADLRVICGSDTAEAVSVRFTPEASVCSEVEGDDPYVFCYPLEANRAWGYCQMLYPAEVAAPVDTLYGIALNYSGVTGEGVERTLDVYIGQTTATSLSSAISVSTHTLAVQNHQFAPTAHGWVRIPFTTPVPLDGVSNLIVTIDDNTGTNGYNQMSFWAHNATVGGFLYYDNNYGSAVNVDPSNVTVSLSTSSNIPDIQLLGGCSSSRCLQPVVSAMGDTNSIHVTWGQRGSESLWQVQYRESASATWILAGTTADTSYTIGGLNASSCYVVRVGSVCDSELLYSEPVTAVTLCGSVTVPYHYSFMVENVACWDINDRTQTSSWGVLIPLSSTPIISPAVEGDLSQVKVRLALRGNQYFLPVVKIGVGDADGNNATWIDSCQFNDPNLQEHTFYLSSYTGNECHILINTTHHEAVSWLHEVYIESITDCQPVQHVAVSQLTDTSALLHWLPASSTSSQWAVYLDGTLMGVATDTAYALLNLQPSTSYTAAVREICSEGDTAEAVTVSFATLSAPMYDLTLNVNDPSMGTVSGGGTYQRGTTVTIAATANPGYHFVSWSDSIAEAVREITVNSDTTLTAYFEADTTQSITDPLAESFALYPNPASTTVTIESDRRATLTLLDVSGRERARWSIENGKTTINISHLPSGAYFVRLEGTPTVKRLIIR